ncbi:MAG: hypothetical protein FWD49_07145 [Firmicutes bacterium]|nr:hypothetical protein [Bacillota bacterium]
MRTLNVELYENEFERIKTESEKQNVSMNLFTIIALKEKLFKDTKFTKLEKQCVQRGLTDEDIKKLSDEHICAIAELMRIFLKKPPKQ